MCHEKTERSADRSELTEEELDSHDGERLPDRKVMSIVNLDGVGTPDDLDTLMPTDPVPKP